MLAETATAANTQSLLNMVQKPRHRFSVDKFTRGAFKNLSR